ncbi:hypothetical protein [Pseudonocardia humida]|uniref:Uncharacterized protein n=1 Tax=Pseudonocardia humida TaxID=2800819 RepID=A0ABT1A5L8_9PSEU|nr:hypothetical protein [Pseudonocardia humida]MCO1658299.1 hypothetical protein [Pseudonocardia humida]
MSTGPGDPMTEAPTTSLDAIGRPPERPPQPPSRPRFEFRPPPSAERTPRPSVLTASSLLWLVAAGALLLAVVLPLVGVGDLWADVTATVARDFPNESPTTRDRAVAALTAGLVGSGVLLALLEGGAAAALRSGRSGARILLALLLALTAVHGLVMIGFATPLSSAMLGAGVALGLVAAVLMFLPGTTAWLAQPRRH